MAINLNRLDARHRELWRSGVRPAQLIDYLCSSPSFPDALPLIGCASSFPGCGFDTEICGNCPLADGHSICHKVTNDQLHQRSVTCKTRSGPTWLCRLSPLCRFRLHGAEVECGSSSSQTVTDRQCAPRRPTHGSRTPAIEPIQTTKPLAHEQLWRQPAKMLEAQPVVTSLKPLPTWRHLGDLCPNQLPSCDRIKVDVERDPYPKMGAPRN